MWLLIVAVLGALLISGLCSLMEAALLSLRPGQIATLTVRRPKLGAIWQRLKADIDRPIAAILIVNTASHTIGASVAGAQFDRVYGDQWIWAFSLVFTFLMLQFTEILPKGAGVRYSGRVAVLIARPLAALVRLMRPVQAVVQLINRPFAGVGPTHSRLDASEEIAALTGFARLSGQMSIEQEKIIRRGVRLSACKVRDVMRPRVDVDALDIDFPAEEVVGAVAMSGYSRVPVYEGDIDRIVGFVYIKDLLMELHMGRPIVLRKLLRPAVMVPETLRLDQLVEMFRRHRTQMAVVLDEYGGTDGLVTMEDVMEEIVGTIHDERREETAEIVAQGEGTWIAAGTAGLDDLLELLGRLELLSDAPGDISTVAGLVQSQLDRVAKVGDRVAWHGLLLEVVEVDGVRIAQVRISAAAEP